MCERQLNITMFLDSTAKDIATTPIENGVECRTMGNYGSYVHDMQGTIFFVLCDVCLVEHSHKMLYRSKAGIMMNGRTHFSHKTADGMTLDQTLAEVKKNR